MKRVIKKVFSGEKEEAKMYKEKEWLQVKRQLEEKKNYSEIGRALNIDRRTVKKLSLMKNPPPMRGKPRQRSSKLDKYKDTIEKWIADDTKIRATNIREKLEKLGWRGSYSTVKRYVRQKKDEIIRKAVVRFETLPGKQAQVDFAEEWVRYSNGERKKVIFSQLTLGFSRMKIVEISEDQSRRSLMRFVEKSFQELGGVPEELLFDNLKPVASKARTLNSSGKLAEEWERFSMKYGFKTKLCIARRPQTKGKVERPIDPIKAYIRANIFLNEEHLRKELRRRTEEERKRVHSTTKQSPIERFAIEQKFLKPLPASPYDFAQIKEEKVSKDCFVSVEQVGYSVPNKYVGSKVAVRITSTGIQIFTKGGGLITAYKKLTEEEKKKYRYVVKQEHYEGLPGCESSFLDLRKLNKMNLGPILVIGKKPKALSGKSEAAKDAWRVEKRSLDIYAKAVL